PELLGTNMEDLEFVLRGNEELRSLQVVTVKFFSKPNEVGYHLKGQIFPRPFYNAKAAVSKRVSEGAEMDMPLLQDESCDFQKLKLFYKKSEWEQLSQYEKQNENTLLEKHTLLKEMGLIPKDSVFSPATRGCPSKLSASHSKKKPARKTKSASRVNLVTRKSSRIVDKPTKYSEDFIEETDDDIFFEDQGGRSESNLTRLIELPTLEALQKEWKPLVFDDDDLMGQNNVSVEQNRTPELNTSTVEEDSKIRCFGQELTKLNALPKFSQKLSSDLDSNKYKMTELLMSIRLHISSTIGEDTYPTSKEYDLLSEALIKRYKYLADDPETQAGCNWIRQAIRKSLSNLTRRKHQAQSKAQGSSRPEVVQEEAPAVSSTW
ncbi:Secreted RxLR effector protein 149, partial [Frankliniella fusca]